MADALNLFPNKVAIGQVDTRGAVYMTAEFSRALALLLTRVGGPIGNDLGDVALETASNTSAAGLHLARAVEQLEQQLAPAAHLAALVGELQKRVAELEAAAATVGRPTDWEHPGKIGAATASTGQFTTVNRVTITAPVGSATLTLADGKAFTVSNTLTLAGDDGATLNIGAGGALGSAAYQNAVAFAARSATALASVATDPASTQALANSLRSVLLSVGIGA